MRFIAVNSVNYRMAFSRLSFGFGFLTSDGSEQRNGYREFAFSHSHFNPIFFLFSSRTFSCPESLLASIIKKNVICVFLTPRRPTPWACAFFDIVTPIEPLRGPFFSSRVELNIFRGTKRDCAENGKDCWSHMKIQYCKSGPPGRYLHFLFQPIFPTKALHVISLLMSQHIWVFCATWFIFNPWLG